MHFFDTTFEPGWQYSPWRIIGVSWIVWVVSWIAASLWSRHTAARPSIADEMLYRIVTAVGAFMVFGFFDRSRPAWEVTPALAWAMVGLTIAGFAFCWWARLTLGTLWSGNVTRKDDHRIVYTGPYALVRHPIYTVLILAAFGTAIARGHIEGLIGVVVLGFGCWIKARLEERFLSEELGADYAAYRARVKMLVPFLV